MPGRPGLWTWVRVGHQKDSLSSDVSELDPKQEKKKKDQKGKKSPPAPPQIRSKAPLPRAGPYPTVGRCAVGPVILP